jgi:hypothetical protein
MAWKKGESGNPGGRKKDVLQELVLKESKNGKVLVDKAFALLKSADEDIQMKALAWLGDRGFYKARQPVEMTGLDGGGIILKLVNYSDVRPK